MEEDDMDFTPTHSTSSNLASLFGFNKTPLQGNPSLTYTAPKAPKKDQGEPENQASKEKTVAKIICSKPVQAYKLENRNYVNQGLSGIVISGNHHSHIYELILYKPNKELLCKTRISRSFSFTVSINNYLSFYDNNKQNWSIMFQSSAAVQEFIEKLTISKFYSLPQPPENILIQDLTPASKSQIQPDSIIEVIYNSRQLEPEGTSIIKNEIKEKIKLSDNSLAPLNQGLVGCVENGKRLILAPHSLSGVWMNELDKTKDLLLEVKVEKIWFETKDFEPKSNSIEKGAESPIESSAEESSIKARGVSIKEALSSTKSQKANLISRMARMGQATLPLKQTLTGPSDSEEEIPMAASPKPRVPRSRGSGNNSHQSVQTSQQMAQNPESLKQVSVYQNDLMWQQPQLTKLGVVHQQLVPVSASPISSPTTDPNLSVYISESRIQATELRMGISKISEKLDLVWNKVQNANVSSPENKSQCLMDTSGILSSIQNLIAENETLRGKVEEQKGKMEQQNDRIFQLLELNHKYLEQNSTSQDKQSENEVKLKMELENVRRKEIQLDEDNKRYSERLTGLEKDLDKAEKTNRKLKDAIDELEGEVNKWRKSAEGNDSVLKEEMRNSQERLTKATDTITTLTEKLKRVVGENESLKSAMSAQREEIEAKKVEIEDSKRRKEEYEKTVQNLRGKLTERSKSESKVEELEKENKVLAMRIEKEEKDKDEEVKKVLQRLSTVLRERFSNSKEYSGSAVLSTIEKCFNDVVEGCIPNPVEEEKKGEGDSKTLFDDSEDSSEQQLFNESQKPKTSKPETISKETESKAEISDESRLSSSERKKEEEKEEETEKKKNEDDKKENVDSRYKSYDQSWRTTKPPPPPLFDDDDDDDDWLN